MAKIPKIGVFLGRIPTKYFFDYIFWTASSRQFRKGRTLLLDFYFNLGLLQHHCEPSSHTGCWSRYTFPWRKVRRQGRNCEYFSSFPPFRFSICPASTCQKKGWYNPMGGNGTDTSLCHQETTLVDILKFGWNSEIGSKFWKLVKILKFGRNSEIWSTFWNLVKTLKFGQDSETWSKFWNLVEILKSWNLVKILKFGQDPEIW